MSIQENQFQACVEEPKVFFARIRDRETGDPLDPTSVTGIRYSVYSLGLLDGQRKESISGHQKVSVPLETLTETIATCPVFPSGYNFRFAPDCRTSPLFPRAGKFEVCFLMSLKIGNPILLTYRFTVE